MDIELARNLVRKAFASGGLLQSLLPDLKQQCSSEEYVAAARDIAEVIHNTNAALIDRALRFHPALKDEIADRISRYGSY